MERKIVNLLEKWKERSDKMPLILNGARQVGKTYSALSFGKSHYKNTVYFNMEDSQVLAAIFERDLEPERIIRELSALAGQTIFRGDTLIIFDEIQACERALTSLKYFCEKAPEYHIIAAGSLLGVALNRGQYSYPVGKVETLTMYPLDFEEFLWALQEKPLCELIYESFDTFGSMPLHDKALELYRIFLVVGGMPRAVEEYVTKRDYDFVIAIQKGLNDAYIADMAKYASPQETTRIFAAWASVPAQLAKENRKFQYKVIRSGARAYEYETPLEWLKVAGMINKCVKVTEGNAPLLAYADNSSFKIYMMDTGLLCSKFNIAANLVINSPLLFDGFKGALAENYTMQALITCGFEPFYWESQGKAELDFVLQNRQGEIIPLEVKAATNVKAKSLMKYIDTYKPPFAIRTSAKNFGYENGIKSIPLYALFCLKP